MADIFNFTDTWNAAGTAFKGIKLAITNTASAAGAMMLELTTSGATTASFTVDKNANVNISAGAAYQINSVGVVRAQTGQLNYFFGELAGNLTGSGTANTAVGYQALTSFTSGAASVAVGHNCLVLAAGGGANTGVGVGAGANVNSGDSNTLIGYNTGVGITTGRANTVLGAGVTGLSAGLSNTVIIADGDGTQRIVVNSAGVMLLAALQASSSYANDAAAAGGGVPVGGLYRNGSVVQIRVV